MAYRDLTEQERGERGRQLADALQHIHDEESDQEIAKKAMESRLDTLHADVGRLKTEVRTGKEWVADQGELGLGE